MDTRKGIDDPDGDIYDRRGRTKQQENVVDGWSSGNVFIVPARAGGAPQLPSRGGISLQAAFSRERYLTAQFTVRAVDPAGLTGVVVPRARAIINWNVRGNHVRRVIDVVTGASISGAAQGFNIDVRDNSRINGAGAHGEVQYFCSAQVSPGVRPTFAGSQPPVLIPDPPFDGFFDVPPGGAATVIPIQQDSGINSYYVFMSLFAFPLPADPTLSPLPQVQIIQFVGAAQAFQNYDGANKWVPLYPGATELRITNFSPAIAPFAAPSVRCSILFGVEG